MKLGLDAGMMEIEKFLKPSKDVLEVHSNEERVSELINDDV